MAKRWALRVDGALYFAEDLTLAECRQLEEETGQSWKYLSPVRSSTAMIALLTCLHARTLGADAARAKVEALTMGQSMDMVEIVDGEDDRPVEHNNGIPVVDPLASPAASATTG